MSVPKSKRQPSQFEVFHHMTRLRKEVTELLLRDFGFSFSKSEERLRSRFGGRSYDELDEFEKEVYKRIAERWAKFEEWFIADERDAVVDCLRNITKEIYIANSIYPVCQEELTERRLHQEMAIGYCFALVQELQYAIETLPVDINVYTRFGKMIDKQISLIKGWRKSDNKMKKHWAAADSATYFCYVGGYGYAYCSYASGAYGVRPDFDTVEKAV